MYKRQSADSCVDVAGFDEYIIPRAQLCLARRWGFASWSDVCGAGGLPPPLQHARGCARDAFTWAGAGRALLRRIADMEREPAM